MILRSAISEHPFNLNLVKLYIMGLSTWALKRIHWIQIPDPNSMWSRVRPWAPYGTQTTRIALLDWISCTVTQHSTQLGSGSTCGGNVVFESGSPISIGSGSKVPCGEPLYIQTYTYSRSEYQSSPLVLSCDPFNHGSRQVKQDPVDTVDPVTEDYDKTPCWQIVWSVKWKFVGLITLSELVPTFKVRDGPNSQTRGSRWYYTEVEIKGVQTS